MSELNDFLKLIEEGKRDYEQNDPVGKKLEEVKQNIQGDIASLFAQLSEISDHIRPDEVLDKEIVVEPIHEVIQEISEESVKSEVLVEDVPMPKPKTEEDSIQQYVKYFKDSSFQQPDVPKIDPTIKAVQDKLKFLEQWVGKISAAGPGSGEVNLRWLDDIDRSTIQDDRYLRYDAHTKKFVFDHPSGSQIGVLDYLALNTNGPGEVPLPGTLSWNPSEDCLNVTQNDGSTLQVGLENYILVHNHTGSNLYNGDVVKFSGVDTSVPDLPLCALMTADYTAQPLYLIGVLTNDIPIGQTGRATILGRVHDLNTTGSDVGETWNVGDILWVHPTLPGKLTKTKPTLPQVAISVAAVVKSGVTDGTLLVRPSIWPRLLYGVFSNTTNHTAAATNTAYPIDLDTINITSGFNLVSNSHITAVESGLYNFNVSIQMSSTNSSSKNVYFWVRKNGTDIPYSTRSVTVNGNNTQATFNCNWPISMNAGQYVQLMWAVSDTTIRLDAPSSTAFAPETPSVLVSITQAAL